MGEDKSGMGETEISERVTSDDVGEQTLTAMEAEEAEAEPEAEPEQDVLPVKKGKKSDEPPAEET